MVTGRTLDQLLKDAEGCQRLHKLVTGEGHFWLPEYYEREDGTPKSVKGTVTATLFMVADEMVLLLLGTGTLSIKEMKLAT